MRKHGIYNCSSFEFNCFLSVYLVVENLRELRENFKNKKSDSQAVRWLLKRGAKLLMDKHGKMPYHDAGSLNNFSFLTTNFGLSVHTSQGRQRSQFFCRIEWIRDWSPKFETRLNIIIGIVQKV